LFDIVYQDSYRKVDVISKEEFDSQRGGADEQRDDLGDSDLVFPLDLQEPTTKVAESAPVIEKPVSEEPKRKHPHERERAAERGRETSPFKGGGASRPKKGRWEKRARFYPVPCKQESPTKVCFCTYNITLL
jgi:hypothetical protein